jgi:type IV pilus assembly protein PilA
MKELAKFVVGKGEKKMLMVLKQQLKKNRKKGFTLVEVIVVLVILAVLAAIAIPALTGYIDKAKDKATISQTRSAVMAAQTLVNDEAFKGTTPAKIQIDIATIVSVETIKGLAGDLTISAVDHVILDNTTIKQLRIETLDGATGYYYMGAYSVTEPEEGEWD